MDKIERLRALEKKYRDVSRFTRRVPTVLGLTELRRHAGFAKQVADDLATLIAELGQEVGAVAEVTQSFDGSKKIGSIYWDRLEVGDKLYTSPAHTSEARDAAVTDEMVERLAKFIYRQEASKCSTLEAFQQHMRHWPRALPEARAMLNAAMRQEAGDGSE